MAVKRGGGSAHVWTFAIESGHTSRWAIGLRLRCSRREVRSVVYRSRHRPYHLVRQSQTLQIWALMRGRPAITAVALSRIFSETNMVINCFLRVARELSTCVLAFPGGRTGVRTASVKCARTAAPSKSVLTSFQVARVKLRT